MYMQVLSQQCDAHHSAGVFDHNEQCLSNHDIVNNDSLYSIQGGGGLMKRHRRRGDRMMSVGTGTSSLPTLNNA